MREIKTKATSEDVTAFLDRVEGDRRREEGHAMRELMGRITGEPAVMWGPTMVGFGAVPYTNSLGTNDWFVVGFSPRKAALTIYGIRSAYGALDPLLEQLGPHTEGKGCVYVKRLENLDLTVLETLIATAWDASKA